MYVARNKLEIEDERGKLEGRPNKVNDSVKALIGVYAKFARQKKFNYQTKLHILNPQLHFFVNHGLFIEFYFSSPARRCDYISYCMLGYVSSRQKRHGRNVP